MENSSRFKQFVLTSTAIFFSLFVQINTVYADDSTNASNASANLCDGIFSIVDRPSKADSACVVPYGDFDLEAGYQYLDLTGGNATGQNYPGAEFRLGLPLNNDLSVSAPNFNTQTIFPHAGFSSTVIGVKHQIGYTNNWLGAVEGLVTLPTGNNAYGSEGTSGAVNAIVTYSFSSALSATGMLGVATQTPPALGNDQRYSSINPDALLSWQINDYVEPYVEVYGQSRTAANRGAGYDADGGLLFLVAHNTEVDVEVAQRLTGNLGGFNHYVGAGIGTLFG